MSGRTYFCCTKIPPRGNPDDYGVESPQRNKLYTGMMWWRPDECPWPQHWVSVGNSKDSQFVVWAKPGPRWVLAAVLSGRFWYRGMDSSWSALPRGEMRPPALAFGHLLLSFKCCSIMYFTIILIDERGLWSIAGDAFILIIHPSFINMEIFNLL